MKIKRTKKKCKSCKEIKSVNCFDIHKINPINGTYYYFARCKDCNKVYMKHMRRKSYNGYSLMRKSRYGLTEEQYQNMIKEQNSKCKLCGKDISFYNIDHDHKTGKIRGILCSSCNTGLGLFKDDIDLLRKAIKYLQ